MNIELSKPTLKNIAKTLEEEYANREYCIREIASNSNGMNNNAYSLIKANERIDAMRKILLSIGILAMHANEKVHLFDNTTDEEIVF